MSMYKKESLDDLRSKIDLVEVVSSHIRLQRSGSSHKACCPFHDEKTPSFTIQRGDTHYHCFGCGAHGDAIAFLMGYLKMGFVEAIEHLAERFQVVLEKSDEAQEGRGPNKPALKNLLEKACQLYHFTLLYTPVGHQALRYLYERGIDLDFIQRFRVGYAPAISDYLQKILPSDHGDLELMAQAGLLHLSESGRRRDFFGDRITFPISDASGMVIGFSARKFKEETFGGKYINTPETPLFKKSSVLFGLSYSRQRIAKERRALIVEGQIDALRLIYAGFDYTVAGQGTAFGEDHVRELMHLGLSHALLAMDGDEAGQKAAVKIGNLFQKKGVEVSIVPMPAGSDPDAFLRERGELSFAKLLQESVPYLPFLFNHLGRGLNLDSPAQKNEIVRTIATQVRLWEHPIMVHESLRRLAEIARVPLEMLSKERDLVPNAPPARVELSRMASAVEKVDPDRILETDLLRWLFFVGESEPNIVELIRANMDEQQLRVPVCKELYALYMQAYAEKKPRDLLALGTSLQEGKDQLFLSEIMQKKINLQRAKEGVIETIQKILNRSWLQKREDIRIKIHSGKCSETEVLELAKQFDEIKKHPPQIII
ncbi:MAG: DNA primase [Chlamydiales bacterium]|nr:DNA primase [Chlamydiales bacterium]